MGRTHALHGLTVGLLAANVAEAAGLPMTVPIGLTMGLLGAGSAIAADLDHGGATASKSLGWISAAASLMIRKLSAWIYAATKTGQDRPNASGHRGITHTAPGAAAMGGVFGGAIAVAEQVSPTAGTVAAVSVIWLFMVWALRALPPKNSHLHDYVVASGLTAAAWFALRDDYGANLPVLLGAVIALGVFVHALGDSLTEYGAPLLWPIRWRGERWYSCGSPRFLRFRAGKVVEDRVVFPLSVVAAAVAVVGVIPGGYAWLGDAVGQVASGFSN